MIRLNSFFQAKEGRCPDTLSAAIELTEARHHRRSVPAYDIIFDEAIGYYGLFWTSQAESLGVSGSAVLNLAKRGRLSLRRTN